MYFTVNLAFVNYFDKTVEALGTPVLRNWTTEEQVLPVSVEAFEINASLLNAPKMLKDFVHQYKYKRKEQICKNTKMKKELSKVPSLVLSSTVVWQIYFSS